MSVNSWVRRNGPSHRNSQLRRHHAPFVSGACKRASGMNNFTKTRTYETQIVMPQFFRKLLDVQFKPLLIFVL